MATNLAGLRTRTAAPSVLSLTSSAVAAAVRWFHDRQRLRSLAALSDATLRDIGLVRGDIDRECLKPFWEPVDYAALEAARRGR